MAKRIHDQRVGEAKTPWTCGNCREYKCDQCVDALRAKAGFTAKARVCVCTHPYATEQAIAKAVEEANANSS